MSMVRVGRIPSIVTLGVTGLISLGGESRGQTERGREEEGVEHSRTQQHLEVKARRSELPATQHNPVFKVIE